MLRTIQKVSRGTRSLAAISRSGASQPGPRSPTFSTLRTVSRSGASRLSGGHYSARKYATKASGQSSNVPEDPKDIAWLNYLETVSRAPWLPLTPRNQEDILRRSYFLVFHMFLYLTRPMSKDPEEDKAAVRNFLLLFTIAPVGADSEIGRSRYAIAIITKQLTQDLASIPESSPLRVQNSRAFALAGDLESLCDTYLDELEQNKPPRTGEIVENGKWNDFWPKAQAVTLDLGQTLKKAGYGITEELMDEAAKKRKENEPAERKK